jgi:predicted anti-sigma-YlaC factor YlaD
MGIGATCKEVHRLTSEGLDRKLSVVERTRVRLHLALCAGCRNFDHQMRLIRNAMRRFSIDDAMDEESKSK